MHGMLFHNLQATDSTYLALSGAGLQVGTDLIHTGSDLTISTYGVIVTCHATLVKYVRMCIIIHYSTQGGISK